jgi:hypothetical protein
MAVVPVPVMSFCGVHVLLQAMTLSNQLPEGWVSWGAHCDGMYTKTKSDKWLEYAVCCYLQVRAPPAA